MKFNLFKLVLLLLPFFQSVQGPPAGSISRDFGFFVLINIKKSSLGEHIPSSLQLKICSFILLFKTGIDFVNRLDRSVAVFIIHLIENICSLSSSSTSQVMNQAPYFFQS